MEVTASTLQFNTTPEVRRRACRSALDAVREAKTAEVFAGGRKEN